MFDQHAILYWFPKHHQPPADVVAEMRARYGNASNISPNSDGPVSGVRGALVGFGHDWPVQYQAGAYRWDRVSDSMWIGARRSGVNPAELQRPEIIDGHPVTLADGNEWLIPVASPLVPTCSLPANDALIDGAWQRVVCDQYRALSDRALQMAEQYREALLGDGKMACNDIELREFVGEVIAVNYNATLQELSALRVFDSGIWQAVIEAFIDWPAYVEILALQIREGGTESDNPLPLPATQGSSDMQHGAAACCPDTGQPAQTPI